MTCDACLQARHFKCRGCGCDVCKARRGPVAPKAAKPKAKPATPRVHPRGFAGHKRTWEAGRPVAQVVDGAVMVDLLRMIRNWQTTGVLELPTAAVTPACDDRSLHTHPLGARA